MANVRRAPVIDIVQRGDDVLIRAAANLRPDEVHVNVREGMLEIRVPRNALRPSPARESTRSGTTGGKQAVPSQEEAPTQHFHPSGTQGAEPPLSAADEKDFWDAQKPLISEDRVTSIHLEGFTDEQANEVMEVLGDDAPEEAQGGSSTGSDVFPSHGGFPSRNPQEEEP